MSPYEDELFEHVAEVHRLEGVLAEQINELRVLIAECKASMISMHAERRALIDLIADSADLPTLQAVSTFLARPRATPRPASDSKRFRDLYRQRARVS
jgi:hypothetical protein